MIQTDYFASGWISSWGLTSERDGIFSFPVSAESSFHALEAHEANETYCCLEHFRKDRVQQATTAVILNSQVLKKKFLKSIPVPDSVPERRPLSATPWSITMLSKPLKSLTFAHTLEPTSVRFRRPLFASNYAPVRPFLMCPQETTCRSDLNRIRASDSK